MTAYLAVSTGGGEPSCRCSSGSDWMDVVEDFVHALEGLIDERLFSLQMQQGSDWMDVVKDFVHVLEGLIDERLFSLQMQQGSDWMDVVEDFVYVLEGLIDERLFSLIIPFAWLLSTADGLWTTMWVRAAGRHTSRTKWPSFNCLIHFYEDKGEMEVNSITYVMTRKICDFGGLQGDLNEWRTRE
jgi:hypothetical protein